MTKAPRAAALRSERSLEIVSLAQRPDGVTVAQVAIALRIQSRQAAGSICSLVESGYLRRCGHGKPYVYRTCSQPERRPRKARCTPAGGPSLVSVGQAMRTLAPQPQGAPPLIGKAAEKAALVRTGQHLVQPTQVRQHRRDDGVLVTTAPPMTHDARYQCDPAQRNFGAGFAAVGVGRNVETGRAWD